MFKTIPIPKYKNDSTCTIPKLNTNRKKEEFSNQKDVYPHCILSQGRERILIELDEKDGVNPDNINKYEMVEKYQNLVRDIVKEVSEKIQGLEGIEREEAFITEVSKVMKSNFQFSTDRNVDGFLYNAMLLEPNEFDCDNSAFLVYDIAKELGINITMVATSTTKNEHVLIKTNNFYFETTTGRYSNRKNYLEVKYSYHIILNENQIQSITYGTMGCAKYINGKYREAIEEFNKSLKLIPNNPIIYTNRGSTKFVLGENKEAIEDLDKAIAINPKCSLSYYNRGNAKAELENYEGALKDYDKAIELNNLTPDFYERRAVVKKKIGLNKEADQDVFMVNILYYSKNLLNGVF